MKEFWNQRYAQYEYAYGKRPNRFFKETIGKYKAGNLLLPAEGEGRNAVFAASKGWSVTAYDYSESGRVKALELAKEKSVKIDYQISNHADFNFSNGTYDAVGLFYTHMPMDKRISFHRNVLQTLKKGGILIMEVFSKAQILYNSGGPKNPQLLYSIAGLYDDFEELMEIEIAKQKVIDLKEGNFHQGEAEVIRLIAHKK